MLGMGSVSYEFGSRVMFPTHAHRVLCHVESRQHFASGGIELTVSMEVDGIRKPLLSKIWSVDDLADAYEAAHHQVHGTDPRGLDPREGPTRLSVGPRR
jgi:hypothetical protein